MSEDDRVVSGASMAPVSSRRWSDIEVGGSDERRRLAGLLTDGRSDKDRL